MKHEKRICN